MSNENVHETYYDTTVLPMRASTFAPHAQPQDDISGILQSFFFIFILTSFVQMCKMCTPAQGSGVQAGLHVCTFIIK